MVLHQLWVQSVFTWNAGIKNLLYHLLQSWEMLFLQVCDHTSIHHRTPGDDFLSRGLRNSDFTITRKRRQRAGAAGWQRWEDQTSLKRIHISKDSHQPHNTWDTCEGQAMEIWCHGPLWSCKWGDGWAMNSKRASRKSKSDNHSLSSSRQTLRSFFFQCENDYSATLMFITLMYYSSF